MKWYLWLIVIIVAYYIMTSLIAGTAVVTYCGVCKDCQKNCAKSKELCKQV